MSQVGAPAFSPSPSRRTTRHAQRSVGFPTAARFAIATDVAPPLTEGIAVAERVRAALMSRSGGLRVFSGKDRDGRLLRGHQHAFVFPEASGAGDRLTHVTLFAPMGFDIGAQRALRGLRAVGEREQRGLELVLLGLGHPDDFAGTNVRAGQCPLFVESTTWVSRTPFIATRHAKTNARGEPKLNEAGLQIGSPRHDLRRLLAEARHPTPVSIDPVASTSLGGEETAWLAFRTARRKGGGRRGTRMATGFRVVFPVPVRGPIALGYGAHFGLGTFVPEALVEPATL